MYDYIAELIDGGQLGGGDKVSEQQICDALNVSRTPVREALIQLAGDGYLENLPRKGFRVKRVDDESAREIFEILGPLDGRAAWLASEHLTDEDCSQLQFLCESMNLAIERDWSKNTTTFSANSTITTCSGAGTQGSLPISRSLNRFFMKREYESVDAETAHVLLMKANEEHAEIVRLLSAHERDRVQDYIRDVHWSIDNAPFGCVVKDALLENAARLFHYCFSKVACQAEKALLPPLPACALLRSATS